MRLLTELRDLPGDLKAAGIIAALMLSGFSWVGATVVGASPQITAVAKRVEQVDTARMRAVDSIRLELADVRKGEQDAAFYLAKLFAVRCLDTQLERQRQLQITTACAAVIDGGPLPPAPRFR
jgi:hypothetical protein